MKIFVSIFLLIIAVACTSGSSVEKDCSAERERISMLVVDSTYKYFVIDSLIGLSDSLQARTDTLYANLFLSDYKVNKVKFYLDIVRRNKSQRKYLLGWMRRAVE